MASRLRTSRAAAERRPLRLVVASAGLVTSGAVAVLAGPVAGAAVLAGPAWHVATQPSSVFSEAPAVTCLAGRADCTAIGSGTRCSKMVGAICIGEGDLNVAEYSRNEGASWEADQVPTAEDGAFIEMASVSCAPAEKAGTDCAAWALLTRKYGASPSEQAAYFSADGGATWSWASPPAPVGQDTWQAPVVVCYELSLHVDCVGSPDGAGTDYSTDGGASWAPSSYRPTPSFGDLEAQDIACALSGARMDCAAVGYVFDARARTPVDTVWYSTDGGRSWAPSSMAQRVGELNAVSCVTVEGRARCAALGSETYNGITANVALYSVDGGRSWSISTFPRRALLPSPWGNVACASSRSQVDCAASGSTLLFSGDGGATWRVAPGPGGAGGDVACVASSPGPSCYVVGAGAAYSDNGGMTWSAGKVGRGFAVQDSMLRDNLSCASPSLCVVAGADELFTTSPAVKA
jgi:hypothetical protein